MWLLIRAFDDDKATAWKLGDIVEVRDDAIVAENGWGALEQLPRFYRIHIPEANAARCKELLERRDESADGKILNRIRLHKLRPSDLPTLKTIALLRDGEVQLSRLQAIAAIIDNYDRRVSLD